MSAVSQACATCEDPARARCARRRVLDAGRPLPEGGARERRADARARAGADYGTRKLLGPLDLEREKEFYADDVVALVAKLFGPEIAGGSLAQADDSRVAEIAAEIRRRYEANLPEEPTRPTRARGSARCRSTTSSPSCGRRC
jgi:hypothetical protein